MPLLLGRRKKFSWKLRPTEKGGKGDEGILVSRPGEIQVVEEGFRANVEYVVSISLQRLEQDANNDVV